MKTQNSELMQSLVLPENWRASLPEILRTNRHEIDPQKEKVRLKSEVRRMHEAYQRRRYENDGPTFWCEVEGLQRQIEVLEQLPPHEIRQAGQVLANLQPAWQAATLDEHQEFTNWQLKLAKSSIGYEDDG